MLLCYAGEWKHDMSVFLLQDNRSCDVRALRKQSPATERKKASGKYSGRKAVCIIKQ